MSKFIRQALSMEALTEEERMKQEQLQASLEAKRQAAIEYLGTKWIMHPSNWKKKDEKGKTKRAA